jgi:hypothetical protein
MTVRYKKVRHKTEADVHSNVCVDIIDVNTGRTIWKERGHNLVPNVGRNLIRDLIANENIQGITRFQLGAGGSTPSNLDTAITSLLLDDLITRKTKGLGNLTCQYYLGRGNLNGFIIREAALVTPENTLYARYALSTPISKTPSIAVVFTWTLAWTAAGMSINIEIGHMVELGGLPDAYVRPESGPNTYMSGSTFDKLVPGSGVWALDSDDLPDGSSYVLEAIVKTESSGVIPKFALFNMTDDPDSPLTGSEVIGSGSVTGELLRSSVIAFPPPGDVKNLGVKITTNNVANGAAAYSIRILRVS